MTGGTDGDAARPPGPEWLRSRIAVYVALTIAAVAIFVFRYEILLEVPYPPSGDAGGDLYLAHAWLGRGFAAMPQSLQTPPLYYFAVVIPFTTAFPTFEGIRLYMAVVPALLVGPGYLFVRTSGVGRWPAVLGGVLLGLSTIWSLMVTWNAAFNLFGILLLLLFLAALARFLKDPTWRAGILVAVTLFLVGLAHPLTFLVAVIALAVAGVLLLLARGPGVLRHLARLVVPATLASLPLLVFYVPSSAGVTTSGGGGSYSAVLLWAIQSGPFFAWGYQGATFRVVVGIDLVVSLLALAAISRSPERRPFVGALAGVLAGAVAVTLLDPANAVRGLYFLPIPFLAPIPALAEDLYRHGWPPLALRAPGTPLARLAAAPSGARARGMVVAAAAVLLVVVNANASVPVMTAGIHFNESLTPDDVAVMDWIRTHTPSNATFIDGAGLEPWMWGYAERMDYAPSPTSTQVTVASQRAAILSDELDMGSYLLANPYWAFASSFPSPIGAPQIYLATPGYWEPFLGTQSDDDVLEVNATTGPHWIGLQYAAIATATPSQSGEALAYRFALNWTSLDDTLTITDRLDGGDLSLAWSAGDVAVEQANYSFGMPPSGYFFDYVSVPQVANASSVTDVLSLGTETFSVELSGGRFTQETLPDGWTQLWYWGSGALDLSASGMQPQNSEPLLAMNTSALVGQLGVDYAIVDVNHDYGMFCRLEADVFWPGPAVKEYQDGTLVVWGR